jgi:hypothetical protein
LGNIQILLQVWFGLIF